MSHPFSSLLKEFQIAIDHLVPTVPEEVKTQAQQTHDALLANEQATEEEIENALYTVGKAEYPFRRAYQEFQGTAGEEFRRQYVLDHVESPVAEKMKKHFDMGVTLDQLVHSQLFETDFTAEERFQIEHGILDAVEHAKEEGEKMVGKNRAAYDHLVEKWKAHAAEIEEKIAVLEGMAAKDPKWKEEILGRVERFREGFSVTEKDPELEDVKKEIEYWRGVFGEEL